MDEIISSMKLIKMYCWENQFAKRISKARNEEIRVIRFANCPSKSNTQFHPNGVTNFRKVALFRALMLTIIWDPSKLRPAYIIVAGVSLTDGFNAALSITG